MEIVAVCDVVEDHMDETIKTFHLEGVKNIRTTGKCSRQEKPDLAAICTESGKHAAIALDCIAAGVNLIIEKPIALSMKDADEIIAAGRRSTGVKVCACHQNRFNKSIQKIRDAVEEGPFRPHAARRGPYPLEPGRRLLQPGPWRGTWAQDGGALMNQCIHNIDLLRWMMGDEVTEVSPIPTT